MSARPYDSRTEAPTDRARPQERSTEGTDVGMAERVVSATVGGTLFGIGMARRSLRGVVMVLVGGWLLYRGFTGRGRSLRSLAPGATERRARREAGTDGVEVTRSITVGLPAEELYDRWQDPGTLSQVFGHVAEVTQTGEDRHRWRVRGPLGRTLEWDARIVADDPGERLRWRSVDGAALPAEGSVQFRPAPGDQGTEVALRLRLDPPGGNLGRWVFERLGFVPDAAAGTALRRFKSLVETGEIPTLERNPSARGQGDLV